MQIRSTYQKKIIYDYIVKSKSHPSINQIHQDLLVNGENIGIATEKMIINENKKKRH